jgi:nitrile hydratase accessory protein
LNRPDPPVLKETIPLGEGPDFTEPWQAEAFALAVLLNRQGLFSWSEWAAALGVELHRPEAAVDASDYYHRWLTALEKLLAGKKLADSETVLALSAAWQRAARATPHGTPISLDNDPERSST